MGCTTSKQGIGPKRRENARSWYNPLPRSVSAPIHNRPLELPSHAHHTFHEDHALTGSFARLLHKKKPLSPTSEHSASFDTQQYADTHHLQHFYHYHNHHHEHAGCIELNPSIKSHMHTLNHPNHTTVKDQSDGDDNRPSAQQLQLVKFITHKHKQLKQDDAMHSTVDQAFHEQSAVSHDAPSFRYPEHSPPSKNVVEHDEIDSGGDGDDEGMDAMERWDITNGLRERRKSRFAPRANKSHHVNIRIADKALSFNAVVALDNDFTEMGSPAWPKKTNTEHPLRKRKKSEDVLDPDASTSLDGLEEQLHGLCSEANAEHTQKGLVKVESPDLESNVPGTGKLSSAFNEVTPGGSKLNTPLRSPSKSPLKGSSSPLFDPSILAMFEEAVESIRYSAPDDDWLLVNDTSNEQSSLSSSDKFTWISSEPSSDEESPLSEEIFSSQIHDNDISHKDESLLHDDNDTKRRKVDGVFSANLERFELRCPPRGEDKVVLYFTSLRGVRKTYQDCCALRLILQGLGVDVDEKDVWMHLKFREELTDLLGDRGLPVPQLFIKGRYIGGVEEVKQLHEDGLLVRLIEDLPTFGKFRKSCDGCADVRFIPCLTCSGSCKLLDNELDQMIKCCECNENGLMMCPICCS